ncbi:hypothetical protein KSP40_PGU015934 [Platanthera guangdongensis]|uniref:Photosystem II protein I n=1 Tax=Platanthera guangdongensis TaxID=2320717 RepID=A0ABR2M300_9ASPA
MLILFHKNVIYIVYFQKLRNPGGLCHSHGSVRISPILKICLLYDIFRKSDQHKSDEIYNFYDDHFF